MSISNFQTHAYQAHHEARLNHLDSLGLRLVNRYVLEVGAGIGDHTAFYLKRRCRVVVTDARRECLREVRRRHANSGANIDVKLVDMNEPKFATDEDKFELVHCYGLLYHLNKPEVAIAEMAKVCSEFMMLETVVSREPDGIEYVEEFPEGKVTDMSQSIDGKGCRPSRKWIMDELRKHFPHVYITRTQPLHAEFPIDWTAPSTTVSRAVFAASRKPLDDLFFSEELLDVQEYA